MKRSPVRRTLLVSLPLGMVLGATGALAGVSLLDEADDHVEKAESALHKAADPHSPGEFGGHRKKALEALGEARREIKKAKDYAHSNHPKPPGPPPSPKPDPTASGGPKKPPAPPVPPKKPDPEPPKKPPAKPPEPPPTPPKK